MSEQAEGIRAKGEEALGELAQALLENPMFSQAVGRALGAGEKAMSAQKSALGAFDVASAGDLERLTRRIRSLSDRVEELEDTVDRLSRERDARPRRLLTRQRAARRRAGGLLGTDYLIPQPEPEGSAERSPRALRGRLSASGSAPLQRLVGSCGGPSGLRLRTT